MGRAYYIETMTVGGHPGKFSEKVLGVPVPLRRASGQKRGVPVTTNQPAGQDVQPTPANPRTPIVSNRMIRRQPQRFNRGTR